MSEFLLSMTRALQDFADSFVIGRWLFLRAMGFVYACAFLSLLVQLRGLIGEQGILPAGEFLEDIKGRMGKRALSLLPTLFWWRSTDRSLLTVCWIGVIASFALMVGFLELPSLIILFISYLSLTVVGQDFLSFQWDVLLIESGFLAIFLAPMELWTGLNPAPAVPPLALLLVWWLLFRLMFESGAVKLSCGDETWRALTSLDVHYQTQPLPNRIAWYCHQAPAFFQRFSVAMVLFIELILPFFFFTPAPYRHAAAFGTIFLMLLIFVSGNYNFFNILTMALCLTLIDDSLWLRLLPEVLVPAATDTTSLTTLPFSWILHALLAFFIILITIPQLIEAAFPNVATPGFIQRLQRWIQPFHLLNSYGLFRNMTLTRPEIVIEGSMDGSHWEAYEFRYKPGALDQPPRFVAPHQPRLDWQMWFAALSSFYRTFWFQRFILRLFEGSEPVLKLLKRNPFPGPPRYLRALLYDYEFTTIAERRATGHWWRRRTLRAYAPVLMRQDSKGDEDAEP